MSYQISNVWRYIAIFFVIVIHCTGPWEAYYLKTPDIVNLPWVVLNQIARFSVPLFLFLSGYGLAKAQLDRQLTWPDFFRKRLLRIGVPFVFWTLVFLFVFGRFYEGNVFSVLFSYFFIKGADYHFYFFIILIQCYLLFPFLFRLVNTKNSSMYLAIFFFAHIIFTSPSHVIFAEFDWWRPSFWSSFVIYWIFFFYCGVFLASKPTKQSSKSSYWIWLGFAVCITILIAEYELWSRHFRDLIARGGQANAGFYNHFTRWSVAIYFLVVIWAIFRRYFRYPKLLMKNSYLGELSFFVFMFHTWVIRLWQNTIVGSNALLLILFTTVFSFGLAIFFNRYIRYPGLRLILGLPR